MKNDRTVRSARDCFHGTGSGGRSAPAAAKIAEMPAAPSPSAAAAPRPRPRRRRRRRVRRIVLPLILLAALGYGGHWATTGSSRAASSSRPTTPMSAPTRRSSRPRFPATSSRSRSRRTRRSTPAICWCGSTTATTSSRSTRPRPRSTRRTRPIARIGRQVEAQRAVIAQAEAQIALAKAQQAERRGRPAARRARIRALAEARATTTSARSSGSNRRPPTARAPVAALAGAKAAQASAEAALAGAKANLDVLQAQQVEAERVRAELVNAEEKAERDLSFTEIRAPFDGVVGNKAVELGQYAQPGVRLMALVALDSVYVDANFKETQLGAIRPGQKVDVAVDALGGRVVDGRRQVDRAGLGRAVLAAAARQRDRQFHQGRAARSGAHRARSPRRSRTARCARACRSSPRCTRATKASRSRRCSARSASARQEGAVRERRRRRTRRSPRPAAAAVASAVARGAVAPPAEEQFDKRKLAAFIFMVFGMFMAILDIQIVSASLSRDPGGPFGLAGRSHLGADELSRRRSHHDPAVGLPVARVSRRASSSRSRPPASR